MRDALAELGLEPEHALAEAREVLTEDLVKDASCNLRLGERDDRAEPVRDLADGDGARRAKLRDGVANRGLFFVGLELDARADETLDPRQEPVAPGDATAERRELEVRVRVDEAWHDEAVDSLVCLGAARRDGSDRSVVADVDRGVAKRLAVSENDPVGVDDAHDFATKILTTAS